MIKNMVNFRSPSILTIFVLLSIGTVWIVVQSLLPNLQRNFALLDSTRLVADPMYVRVAEPRTMKLSAGIQNVDVTMLSSVCQDGMRQVAQAHRCLQLLFTSIDKGMALDELTPYLQSLVKYPSWQTGAASYAGEVWYRYGAIDEAIAVWQNWLPPFQRIDKATRLFDAGYTDSSLLLINSLDPELYIESGFRRSSLIRILVQAAQVSSDAQDFDAAANYWRRSAGQRPDLAAYHFNLAMALGSLGRWDEALVSLREAERLEPESFSYQLRLAEALERLGYRDEAKGAALKAFNLKPDNEAVKNLLDRLNLTD